MPMPMRGGTLPSRLLGLPVGMGGSALFGGGAASGGRGRSCMSGCGICGMLRRFARKLSVEPVDPFLECLRADNDSLRRLLEGGGGETVRNLSGSSG